MLQAQIRRSLPLLDPECAPRQQQRSAADAVAALEGLAQGLEHQVCRIACALCPCMSRTWPQSEWDCISLPCCCTDDRAACLVAVLQERRWRAKALPALQRDAHAIWQAGRKLNRGGTCGADEWRDDAAMFQASTPSSSGTNHATLYLTLAGGPQWRPLILVCLSCSPDSCRHVCSSSSWICSKPTSGCALLQPPQPLHLHL